MIKNVREFLEKNYPNHGNLNNELDDQLYNKLYIKLYDELNIELYDELIV